MYRADMHELPGTGTVRLKGLHADTDHWALFIDIDGTLLEMAPTPDAARVPPGLVQTLGQLTRSFGGAVALITGRRVADADRFFAPLKLTVSGVHGTEARNGSGDTVMLAAPVPDGLTDAVRGMIGRVPGILVEEKGTGLAVHYRNAPEARAALEMDLRRLIDGWGRFTVRPGRKVLEIVPKTHTKGTGLTSLMRSPPFQGRRPIMIGDDRGDEPAMEAAERLGGIGLKVAGEHFGREGADFDGPAGVRIWLASLGEPAADNRAQGSGRVIP